MNYQYTYFIHPFIIKEGKYQKDKDCKLKIFQKEKDLKMYQYFLPKTREFLFSSFSFENSKIRKLEELPIETRAAILSKCPCNIFEYILKKDIQGKVDCKKGIFFTIQKIEVVCFHTGICFLVLKTNLEENATFEDVHKFNYKFRDINQEEAFEAMKASLLPTEYAKVRRLPLRGKDYLADLGYLPYDGREGETVAKNLEYYLASWAVAQVAGKLGH